MKKICIVFLNFLHKINSYLKFDSLDYEVINKTLENKDFPPQFPKGDIGGTDVDKSISSHCLNGEPLDEDMDCLDLRISYIDTEISEENTTEKGIQENAQSGQKDKSPESSESEFVFQAYDCWRQVVGCKTQLSQTRREKLAELLENHFASLKTWKSFCEQIRNTPFLMGQNRKHWRITLEWLLNPANFQKVQDGNYQDTLPVQAAEGRPEHSDDLKMYIKANLLEHELSQNLHDPRLGLFVKDLRAYQGDARFISWNHSLWFFIEGDILQVMCDSAFQIVSMQDRYGQDYEKAAHKAGFKGVILQTSREFTKNNPGVRHAS